ncbi:hypothetical protein CEV34_3545 [Brucella pseudogrignonensis]|uniref:Uncharacterized protein n=1 Tax=Brucella pseudogrignonensis TaxID=419475 RepID=A0A256GA59_9HYPH|nr:hypothetical protein CEV34_3545 [Brucella pseudogrignonensis]
MINASIVFEDAEGDMLFSSYIDQGLTLAPHETHGFQATIMKAEALYHLRKQTMKASVCMRSLKYSDGRIQNFDSGRPKLSSSRHLLLKTASDLLCAMTVRASLAGQRHRVESRGHWE